jgi:hypothetical protein
MYRLMGLLIICLLLSPCVLFSAEKTFYAEYAYELGENDSRNDARQYTFFKAKKKLMGETGKYMTGSPAAIKSKVTLIEINKFLPTLLKIEVDKEEWKVDDDKLKLTLTLKTGVDTEQIVNKIVAIQKSKKLKNTIENDRKKIAELEKEYEVLSERLKKEGKEKPVKLRKDRQVIAEKLDRLEKIKYFISSKTKSAKDKISVGMTIDEVIDVAGQPRATMACERPDFLNYGEVWVMLRNGIVTGMVSINDWKGPCLEYGRQGGKMESDSSATPMPDEIPKHEIIMKNGKIITTSSYYEIEGVVYYKRYGGIVGIEKTKIVEIRDIE